MANLYKINPLVLVGVPTLLDAPMSWEWADYYQALAFPLGASIARTRIKGRYVDEARNAIVEQALTINADYVLFISDDVLAPPRTFEMLWRHRRHMATGVYWTKGWPSFPYLWNGLMKGPHLDWTYGEFFKVDWAGCDCLLVSTEVFRKIKVPGFSRDWSYQDAQPPAYLATEDLYVYTKAREAGFELWCDSAVQCDHQDRETKIKFGLTEKMPQAIQREDWKLYGEGKKIADIGCGMDTPYFGPDVTVVRIDERAEVKPTIQCDIRVIPHESEVYDVVHARHVLEHFYSDEAPSLLKEWVRILKVGGELIINVPNLAFCAREILKAHDDKAYDASYAYWQLYGLQNRREQSEIHKTGFTRHGLERLFSLIEHVNDVQVREVNDGVNLEVRCTKSESSNPFVIVPAWNRVAECENGNTHKPVEIAPQNGKVETAALTANEITQD